MPECVKEPRRDGAGRAAGGALFGHFKLFGKDKTLEKKLRYSFRNRELLSEALNHSSYANEHRGGLGSNERLEFLGDSVLGFVAAEFLFKTTST